MGYVLADQIARRVLDLEKPLLKSALVATAFYGDNDGRNVLIGAPRLALALECDERTARRLLVALRRAGWLLDDGWVSRRPPLKRRRIAIERLGDYPTITEVLESRATTGQPDPLSEARTPTTGQSDLSSQRGDLSATTGQSDPLHSDYTVSPDANVCGELSSQQGDRRFKVGKDNDDSVIASGGAGDNHTLDEEDAVNMPDPPTDEELLTGAEAELAQLWAHHHVLLDRLAAAEAELAQVEEPA